MTTPRVFYDGTLTDPRLDHPEGVAVHLDGSIWCGGESGQLYRIAPDGSHLEQVASTGGFALGVDVGPDGRVYLCDLKHRSVFSYTLADGLVELTRGGDQRFTTPNMVRAAADGTLFVTDSHVQGTPGGGVYRFAADGVGGLWWDEPMDFANGIALSPDGSAVYVVETFAAQLSRIGIGTDGQPTEKTVVARLPGVLPDGVTFGPDGWLYLACYEPSMVLRVPPEGGRVQTVVQDPTAHLLCHPTNVAFRGPDMFTSNLGRWHITLVKGVAERTD